MPVFWLRLAPWHCCRSASFRFPRLPLSGHLSQQRQIFCVALRFSEEWESNPRSSGPKPDGIATIRPSASHCILQIFICRIKGACCHRWGLLNVEAGKNRTEYAKRRKISMRAGVSRPHTLTLYMAVRTVALWDKAKYVVNPLSAAGAVVKLRPD